MGSAKSKQKLNCEIETNFCGRINNSTFNIHKDEKNEIILSKTYSYPKGTYSIESTKFFNENEKFLFYFCEGDNIAAIRYLTIKGVHINILDQDRTSPIHIACRSGSLQLVEEILNQGGNLSMPDIVGWTALHVACYYKRQDVILLLLKYGANLNIKDRDGIYAVDLISKDQPCLEIINNFILHSFNNKKSEDEIERVINCDAIDEDFESYHHEKDYASNTIEREDEGFKEFYSSLPSNFYSTKHKVSSNNQINNNYASENYKSTGLSNYSNNNTYSKKPLTNSSNNSLMKNMLLYKNKILSKKINPISTYSYRSNDKELKHANNIYGKTISTSDKKIVLNHRSFLHSDLNKESYTEDQKLKKDQQKILDNYKVIPKKHKFYMNYKNTLRESNQNVDGKYYGKTFRVSSNTSNSEFSTFRTSIRGTESQKNQILKSQTSENRPDFKKYNLGDYPMSIIEIKNSMIKIPKQFPTTQNLKKLLKYENNEYIKDKMSNVNHPKLRNSYNHNFLNNNYNFHQEAIISENTKSRQVFSDDEYEERQRETKRLKIKKEISHDQSRFNSNYLPNNTDVVPRPNFFSYRGMPDHVNIMLTTNNYKIDSDSEKYKVYDSMSYGSDDSFILDSSVIKESTPVISSRNKESSSNVQTHKARNKSFVNIYKHESPVKKNKSEEELDETVWLHYNDYEDSIIFSEEIASIKPEIMKNKKPETVIFNEKYFKIFKDPETEYFLTKIKFSELFFNIFKVSSKEIESITLEISKYDSYFAILFFLNVIESDNSCEKLITFLKKIISSKELIGMFLVSTLSTQDVLNDASCLNLNEIKNIISEKYFESFEFEKSNLKESIRKCFQKFKNSLIYIDQLSKLLSKHFSKKLSNNKDSKYLLSEHAIYMLTFTILCIDVDLKEYKTSNSRILNGLNNLNTVDNLKKKFIDMVIILKNLNDGENFDSHYLKDIFKFSRHLGLCNVHNYSDNTRSKNSIGLIKNGKHKQYFYVYLSDGILLLFNQKNSDKVNKFIYLKNPSLFIYKYDFTNLILGVDSKGQNKNIFIFKNKEKYIKYFKHNSIYLKFESETDMKNLIQNLYSNPGLIL